MGSHICFLRDPHRAPPYLSLRELKPDDSRAGRGSLFSSLALCVSSLLSLFELPLPLSLSELSFSPTHPRLLLGSRQFSLFIPEFTQVPSNSQLCPWRKQPRPLATCTVMRWRSPRLQRWESWLHPTQPFILDRSPHISEPVPHLAVFSWE